MFAEVYDFLGAKGVTPTIAGNELSFTIDEKDEDLQPGIKISAKITVKKVQQTEEELEANCQKYFV